MEKDGDIESLREIGRARELERGRERLRDRDWEKESCEMGKGE